MLPTARAAPLLAVAAAACIAADCSAWAGDSGRGGPVLTAFSLDEAAAWTADAAARALRWIETGYARRPAVMIGLAGALLLPLLLLVGAVLYRRRAGAAPAASPGSELPILLAPRLEIEGAWAIALPVHRDLVQIGRQEDNDICLEDDSVQRYHAVIERRGEFGFTIVDVSGPDGAGLRVNGERRVRAVLVHGDTLEVGNTRMRFATAA